MCQLTLIDIKSDTKLAKATIRSLTEINSIGIIKESSQVNEDGFGYMTFSKAPAVIKSEKSAIDWWDENENEFHKSIRNANGIYHVRSSSRNISVNYQKDAHPFNVGDITLAHNGTLDDADKLTESETLQKTFPKTMSADNKEIPMIDSEKYTRVLANIVGDKKLKPVHLVRAMDYFTGSFALLIHDNKQPSKVFIARGRSKKLYQAVLFHKKERIGFVLNTGEWELFYWARVVKSIAKEYLGIKVKVLIQEIEEDSVFIYKLGSYKDLEACHEIKQNTKVYIHSRKTVHQGHGLGMGYGRGIVHSNIPIWKAVLDLAKELKLSLSELMLISEITLDQCIHTLTPSKMDILLQILEGLKQYDFSGRYKVWNTWLDENNMSPKYGYKITGLDFPFMFNSKKKIKSLIKKTNVKKGGKR